MAQSPLRTPLGALATFLAAPLSGYWWWSYSGPYRWIAELQLAWFNGYEVMITFLLTLVLTALVVLAVIRIPARMGLFGHGWVKTNDESAAPAILRPNEMEHQMALGMVVALSFGLIVGLVMLVTARGSRQLITVSVEQLEQGVVPASGWIEVLGSPLHSATIEIEENHRTEFYVPVVSDSWAMSKPVAAIIQADRREMGHAGLRPGGPQVGRFRGMKNLTGLPGIVRTACEDEGLLVADAIVIALNEEPGDRMPFAIVMTVASALGLLATIVVWLSRRDRRREPVEGPAVVSVVEDLRHTGWSGRG